MWPDDLDLAAQLAAAGARARDVGAASPNGAYASGLRDRLLASLPAAEAPITALPRRKVGFRELVPSRRMAPLLAAALLLVAVAAAARTVLVGTDPAPPPTPGPSLPVIVGPAGGGLIETARPSPISGATTIPFASTSANPSLVPTPAATPSGAATPVPTPGATPGPTPDLAPKPTPIPTPSPVPTAGTLSLTLSGCNGGMVIEWSTVADARFHRYTTLRSGSADVPAAYPPEAGVVEVPGTAVKDPSASSAADGSAPTGTTLYYRTLALDAENRVLAASAVRSAVAKPMAVLGTLTATPAEPGKTTFGWAPYTGPGACFSYYKLVYSETDSSPSYLGGAATWAALGDQASTSVTIGGPVSGTTYQVRLEALRATAAGKLIVARSDVLNWTAP